MRSRRAARHAVTPPSPLEEYQRLGLADIMADLPSLDLAGLRLVQYLEESGQGRVEILDAIARLVASFDERAEPVVIAPVVDSSAHMGDAGGTAAAVAPPLIAPAGGAKRFGRLGRLGRSRGPDRADRPDRVSQPRRADRVGQPDGQSPAAGPARTAGALAVRSDVAVRSDAVDRSNGAVRPGNEFSDDLFDRVDGLLARDSVKRQAADPATRPGSVPLPAVIGPGRRSRQRGARLAKVLAGVVTVAVISAGASVILGRQGHTAGSTALAAPVNGAASTAGDPLERLMLKAVPAGYIAQPDAAVGAGSLDVAKAARSGGVADAQAVLTGLGFVRGFERLWQTADQRQIVVYLYKFNVAASATAYGQQLVTSARSNRQIPVADFPITGIPGAVGLSRPSGDVTSANTVVFAKGQYLVRFVVSRTASADHTTAQQLAQAQYAAL